MKERVVPGQEMFPVVGRAADLVEIEMVHPRTGHLQNLLFQEILFFRNGGDFHRHDRNDPEKAQVFPVRQKSVGVKPDVKGRAEVPSDLCHERQGPVQGEERFAAADTHAPEPEFFQIGDVFPGFGKGYGAGHGNVPALLLRWTVKTVSVADTVYEKAGPGPLPAKPAARGKVPHVHLGPTKTEDRPAFKHFQKAPPLLPGLSRRLRADPRKVFIERAEVPVVRLPDGRTVIYEKAHVSPLLKRFKG